MVHYNLLATEQPTEIQFGANAKHVPLNVRNVMTSDEPGYLYDMVENVAMPVSVDTIIDAAIESKYTEEQRRLVLRGTDAKLSAEYQAFVANIRTAAIAAGY